MDNQDRQEALRELISEPAVELKSSELQELAENDPELILEELLLTREAYESWRNLGRTMDRALLEIWHMVTPGDSSGLTFGDDAEVVVEAVREHLRKSRP